MDNSSVRRVRMVNNRPSLLLDGEDTLPLICALSDFPGADSRTYQAHKNIAAFCRAGINLVACDTNLLLGRYKAAEGDYDALRAELSYVLDANPDAQRCCEDEGVSVLADGEIVCSTPITRAKRPSACAMAGRSRTRCRPIRRWRSTRRPALC